MSAAKDPAATDTSVPHGASPVGGGAQDSAPDPQPSLGELLSEISKDISTLMRQEVALAKAEVTDTATKAGKGAGMLAGAGVAGHFVLLFLSIALWWALGDAIGNGLSAVVVAVLWGIIAAVLAAIGRKELKKAPGAPQTAESVKKIPNALQGHEEKNR